jgi:hypothetical protein
MPDALRHTPASRLEAVLLACRELDAHPKQVEEWRLDVMDPGWRDRRREAAMAEYERQRAEQ